jgi:hypothetical protein
MMERKEGSAVSLVVLAMLLIAAVIMSILLGRRAGS